MKLGEERAGAGDAAATWRAGVAPDGAGVAAVVEALLFPSLLKLDGQRNQRLSKHGTEGDILQSCNSL